MPTVNEAQSRDSAFRASLSYPSLVWDVMRYEYGMRGTVWKHATFNGMQWLGIPGLRGIALGSERNLVLGGGDINQLGIKYINRPVGSLLERVGRGVGSTALTEKGRTFAQKGIGGFLGKVLGGTTTNFGKVGEFAESSRPAVKKALETDWGWALLGKNTKAREDVLKKITKSNLRPRNVFGRFTPIKTPGVAWKFAMTQKFLPAAAWIGNFALAASFVAPVFSAAGEFISGQITEASRFIDRFDRRSLEFGGKIHQSYLNRAGVTERQRSLQELRTSRTNARTFIGNEGQLYHS